MQGKIIKAFWILGLICPGFGSPVAAQASVTTEEQALASISAIRQQRLANAVPIELWAPLPDFSAADRLSLVLNNAFGLELKAEVDLIDEGGQAMHLGSFKVPPSRHHKVDLGPALTSDRFASARSIRVSYPGDIEMFQSWLIYEGAGAQEVPLRSSNSSAAQEVALFWDASWLPGNSAEAIVSLINTSGENLELHGSYWGFEAEGFTVNLAPRGSTRFVIPPQRVRGILVLNHEGPAGALLASAVLESRGGRLTLPVSGDDSQPKQNLFASVRLPPERSFLALANLEADLRSATLSLFDPRNGGLIAVSDLEVQPATIATFDVAAILQKAGSVPVKFTSALLRVDAGRVLVAAGSVSSSGRPVDAPVFAAEMAHQNGSYPILDTSRFGTAATLLNLGNDDSMIGGQVVWEGGSYAIGPIRIPAGGATEIDLKDKKFAENQDRKGRALPSRLPAGYFQWTVLRGSHSILARTEARPIGSDDAVGFNCLGCCEEYSYGRIEPDGASFLPGQVKTLGANEYIASCGATLGPFQPYFTYLNVPSPFSWDGDNVGAWQAALNSVYFEGEGERVHPPRCESRIISFGDGAPVQSLRVTIDEVSLPLDRIRVSLSPIEASGLLSVTLRSPALKDLIYNSTYSGGTYTFTFSPLAAYSEGQEFSEVFVQWKASIGASAQTTASAIYPYRFKVGLGLRTVADFGGGLSTRQLDHYAGTSGCNAPQSLGNHRVFKLCPSNTCS